ncbi:DUF3311 domain-containing protein [Terribacillus sp. 7520-G]|uniref:DUF3311 domain-containing protein n=1 Tax=Terribacillus TaxID=459532 RepID=UPI000BA567E2|nr:DUF3311 domain-containing protein [Terribacillus sp. 7520-G]PAD37956.1 hypothetical protein CHH53_13595 [Terribacillus sp. 7520-G]
MKRLYFLTAIPFIGMLGFLPFANRVEPFVLSMPFVMFWVVLWTVLSSVILVIMYKLDPRNEEDGEK